MQHAPLRVPVPGATLARQLARLAGQDAVPPAQSPADRLGDWLDWQRAVALSRALDDAPAADPVGPAASPAGAGADGASAGAGDPVEDCRGIRAALGDAIADDARDWTRPRWPRAGDPGSGLAAGAGAVQRHCLGLQRDMQAASGRLRGELRERLARHSPGAARLAAVDAVMEGLLAPREHALLAPVVPALVARFEQLHARHHPEAGAGAEPSPGDAWRARFRGEARQVLLAELDLRFQPIEALLAALRTP